MNKKHSDLPRGLPMVYLLHFPSLWHFRELSLEGMTHV